MTSDPNLTPKKKTSNKKKVATTSSKENVFSFPLDRIQVSGQQMYTPRISDGDNGHEFSNSYNMVKKSNSDSPNLAAAVTYTIPKVREVFSLEGLKELIQGVGFSNIPTQLPEMVRQNWNISLHVNLSFLFFFKLNINRKLIVYLFEKDNWNSTLRSWVTLHAVEFSNFLISMWFFFWLMN